MRTRLLSYAQVAEILGCSKSRIRWLARKGRLRRIVIGHRTVRFNAREVAAFIQASGKISRTPGKEGFDGDYSAD